MVLNWSSHDLTGRTTNYSPVMVGYGKVTKGYRLYNATEGKVIHSRNVQFNGKIKESRQDLQVSTQSDYQPIAKFPEIIIILKKDHNVLKNS